MRHPVRSLLATAAVAWAAASPASAAPMSFDVQAQANSSTGGTALNTGIALVSGDRLVTSALPGDCWSAGGGDRTSNADGLVGLTAQPTCRPAPSSNFGLYTQDGETFAFGSLVARIGSGDWFKLGTAFDGIVTGSGTLFMAYWDSNSGDNSGFVTVTADVNPRPGTVPTPATAWLTLMGLGALALARRTRRG